MRLAVLAAFALAVVTDPALAQRPEAERLIDEGVELRRAGKEREALERFRQAYELDPSPRAQGQMGLAAKSLRLWVEAERHLQGALSATSDAWVDKNRAALEQALEVVSNNVASLRVETNAPSAKLYVNGRELTDLPMSEALRVVAGAAQLEVRAPGYQTARRRETLPARRVTALRIELEAEAPAPPAPAPVPIETPAPAAPPPPERDDGGTQRTWAWVAGGVGLVGIGAGTYFGLRTLSLKSERDDVCPDAECTSQRGVDLDESARSSALVSTIGFGVGAAALGTAAVLWLTAPKTESEAPSVGAALGPRGASATLRLRF